MIEDGGVRPEGCIVYANQVRIYRSYMKFRTPPLKRKVFILTLT